MGRGIAVLNILKRGVGKGKSCSKGGGGLKVSPPLPPWKILIIHYVAQKVTKWSSLLLRYF